MIRRELKRLRKQNDNISQADLSEKAGFSRHTVSFFVKSKHDVGFNKIEKIFNLLGYTLKPVPLQQKGK